MLKTKNGKSCFSPITANKNDFIINVRYVPRGVLKTSGYALGFQHSLRNLANVNEWKIMFDPYVER